MFNVFSLLLDDAVKPATSLTEQHNRPDLSLGCLGAHVTLDQRWSRNWSVSSSAWVRCLTFHKVV